jgi:hypothetical protein
VAACAAAGRNRFRILTLAAPAVHAAPLLRVFSVRTSIAIAAGMLIVGTPPAHASLEDVVRDDLELARERLAAAAAAVPPGRYPAWTGPGGNRGNFDTGLAFGDYYFVEALGRFLSPPRPPDEPTIEVRRLHAANGRRVEVAADEPGRVKAALLAGPATARKLDLDNLRSAVLARGSARLEEPGKTALRLRLASDVKRDIRNGGHARALLSVVVRPANGSGSATLMPFSP